MLENHFLPGGLEAQIEASPNITITGDTINVTPADAYFGRAETIIKQRERIKRKTIEPQRLQHRRLAA